MIHKSSGSDLSAIFKITIANAVLIILVVALVLLFGWLRSKRNESGRPDVDWDSEKERLRMLASEKKAQRGVGKRGKRDIRTKD
jgi:hypothetical protein